MLQTVQAHLGSHSSKYGSCCIARKVFYLSDSSQSLDANRITTLNIAFTICLSLVLCIPQCSCSLLLILFLFSLALGMAFFALLDLSYLAGKVLNDLCEEPAARMYATKEGPVTLYRLRKKE